MKSIILKLLKTYAVSASTPMEYFYFLNDANIKAEYIEINEAKN